MSTKFKFLRLGSSHVRMWYISLFLCLVKSAAFLRSSVRLAVENAEPFVRPATVAGIPPPTEHPYSNNNEVGKVLQMAFLTDESDFNSTYNNPVNATRNTPSGEASSFFMNHCDDEEKEEIYRARIEQWKVEYANLDAYRERYGKCSNIVWGDWGLAESRLRYLALIQEALLQLTMQGTRDEDLGFLAAQAKQVIKKYVRERSMFPCRLIAEGLDGSRQWATTGAWDSTGKNYQQLRLEKMAAVIDEEGSINHLTDHDLERKVSLKIFNSAAKTNPKVDHWSLRDRFTNVSSYEKLSRDSQEATRDRNATYYRGPLYMLSDEEIEDSYRTRIEEWRREYADVEAYRDRYGRCENKVWGCWSLLETRLRYLAFIQEALLRLTMAGARDEDLGYLATEARSAIKKYVRERSQFPWRMVAEGLDGSRQLLKTGEWTSTGKTYRQLRLEKTAAVIAKEGSISNLTDSDLERRVSLEIFKSAAKTNTVVDNWSLQHAWVDTWIAFANAFRPVYKTIVCSPQYLDLMETFLIDSTDEKNPSPVKSYLQERFPECTKKMKVYIIRKKMRSGK